MVFIILFYFCQNLEMKLKPVKKVPNKYEFTFLDVRFTIISNHFDSRRAFYEIF